MLCHEIMTRDPRGCTPEDSAMRAAKVMKIADVGLVPVCSSGDRRRLLGVITDRDLCLAIVAENMDAATTTIDKCMTRNPVSCRMDEDLDTALQRMEAHQIRRIPVVDNDGNLVGI